MGVDTGRNTYKRLCGDGVMNAKKVQPRQTSSAEPTTQPVVELLTSILNEVQRKVRSETPKPLEGNAVIAVDLFREIGATLAFLPTITLKADPTRFPIAVNAPAFFKTKLTWSSTEAQTVSIDRTDAEPPIGEVKPAAGGSKEVLVRTTPGTTIFTATAKGPCGSATATAVVTVA
jgi:hypothetical protein